MIIYGWRTFKKLMLQLMQVNGCQVCRQNVQLLLVREWTWVTLFWIPICPLVPKYSLVCPACGSQIKLQRKEAKQLLAQQRALGATAPADMQLPAQNAMPQQ